MSTLLKIICRETRQELSIGQRCNGTGEWYAWTGEPRVVKKLGKFLVATMGKQLEVMSEHAAEELELDEFEQPKEKRAP